MSGLLYLAELGAVICCSYQGRVGIQLPAGGVALPTLGKGSRLPGAGAKPIFFFFAKKKKTVLDAKRKRMGLESFPSAPVGRRPGVSHWHSRLPPPAARRICQTFPLLF